MLDRSKNTSPLPSTRTHTGNRAEADPVQRNKLNLKSTTDAFAYLHRFDQLNNATVYVVH
jgi:hypothetical protein